MKQIYKARVINTLNDSRTTQTLSMWHYGEVPATEVREWTIDDLKCGVDGFEVAQTLFRRKWLFRLTFGEAVYSEKQIKRAKTVTTYAPVCSYTIRDLIDKMNAEDFVEWCKDHELTSINFAENT